MGDAATEQLSFDGREVDRSTSQQVNQTGTTLNPSTLLTTPG